MKFKDFAIGDWFCNADGWEYAKEAVFIKISDTVAYCINWSSSPSEYEEIHEEAEFEFVPQFIHDIDFTDSLNYNPYGFDDFENPSFTFISHFNDLPMGCIYKGKGQTYYKRISNNETLVVWSPNTDTMGKIFIRDDWETHDGHYYICNSGWFTYPEGRTKSYPNMYNPNAKFSF